MALQLENLIVNSGSPMPVTISLSNNESGNRVQLNSKLTDEEVAAVNAIVQRIIAAEISPNA